MMSMFKKNVSYNERPLRRKITAEELLYALKDYTKSQVKNLLESMDSSSFIKLLEQCHYEQFVSRDDRELLLRCHRERPQC